MENSLIEKLSSKCVSVAVDIKGRSIRYSGDPEEYFVREYYLLTCTRPITENSAGASFEYVAEIYSEHNLDDMLTFHLTRVLEIVELISK